MVAHADHRAVVAADRLAALIAVRAGVAGGARLAVGPGATICAAFAGLPGVAVKRPICECQNPDRNEPPDIMPSNQEQAQSFDNLTLGGFSPFPCLGGATANHVKDMLRVLRKFHAALADRRDQVLENSFESGLDRAVRKAAASIAVLQLFDRLQIVIEGIEVREHHIAFDMARIIRP